MQAVRTIHRHIQEQAALHPESRGSFSRLLSQICLAAKVIGHHVNRAGLVDVLGGAGLVNIQGEVVQKLDLLANAAMKDALLQSGTVAALVSEEEEAVIHVPEGMEKGDYIVHFDPLDGSSNIDANVSIGTIFAIYRRKSSGDEILDEDIFQPGKDVVGAGYIIYGSSTMLVYTSGNGVHGFTYDPSYGEFLLSHENIHLPDPCKVMSVNEAYSSEWPAGITDYLAFVKSRQHPRYEKTTFRYIGSLVADVHRNLLYGGFFLYPETISKPEGKLRLLYEAIPLSFVVEQAGGKATTGHEDILEITPTDLHQRVPLYIGHSKDLALFQEHSKLSS
jgi:fructose-1,6-bisphosphatase I